LGKLVDRRGEGHRGVSSRCTVQLSVVTKERAQREEKPTRFLGQRGFERKKEPKKHFKRHSGTKENIMIVCGARVVLSQGKNQSAKAAGEDCVLKVLLTNEDIGVHAKNKGGGGGWGGKEKRRNKGGRGQTV